MDAAELFLLEPGAPLEEQSEEVCPNFGQGYRPDLFVPEIRMREALDFATFWQYAGRLDSKYREEIPYWCIVWPGSRMLARFALDENQKKPGLWKNRKVLELGCGSGLASVAFGRCEAQVIASDHDGQALKVARATARKNGLDLQTCHLDLFDDPEPALSKIQPGLMVMGDLFYEAGVASRAALWSKSAIAMGISVLVADPTRTYGPHKRPAEWGLSILQEARVPVHKTVENVKGRHTVLLGHV
ncbi:MAG: methyltransferase [Leptospiraceae bacterium]|nr:methyltransferase [Leptospiraceae bacterium]MCB1168771.1 methyltransferase [Leptospiraceae bacterium]